MSPAIVCGIVSGDAPVSYWLIFSPSQVAFPEVFAKVYSLHSEVATNTLAASNWLNKNIMYRLDGFIVFDRSSSTRLWLPGIRVNGAVREDFTAHQSPDNGANAL